MAPKKAKARGRPTKLDATARGAIVEAIATGLSLESAAALAGVHSVTVWRWLDGKTEAHADFRRAVAGARARREDTLKEQIETSQSGPGLHDWKASAWLLERSHPEQYGASVQIRAKVESELADVVERLRQKLDPATFRVVAEALASAEDDS